MKIILVLSKFNFYDKKYISNSDYKLYLVTKKDSITNNEKGIDEIVVSGTLKPVLRSETLVPVEIYTATFLRKNPTSNLFEALQSINGVRPQLNCNICNTGDIHINGLEGPYTMVTIDGMPIVSALSTVYGLSGIPNALIDRIEIIKDLLLHCMAVKLLGTDKHHYQITPKRSSYIS